MSGSLGPIAAATAIVVANAVVVHDKTLTSQTRVVVGGAIAAAGLTLAERALPGTARAVAWLTLVTVLLVRTDPAVPSPAESFKDWYNAK